MQALDEYLDNPPPRMAFLIEGGWGSGKSFWWNRYTQNWRVEDRVAITFSAAGLESYDELESALFQASIEDLGTGAFREAAKVFGRTLLRYAKIDPNDIRLKAETFSGKTVICIDDVERFAGKFRILFGFVVNLLDRNVVHCVLLADESRAQRVFDADYDIYKERIVGRTVRLKPDVQAFVREIVDGFADEMVRRLLVPRVVALADRLVGWKVANLRTVRQYLTELASILKRSRASENTDLDAIISAIAFWVIAVSKNASNTSIVSKLFSTDTFGIAYRMARAQHQNGRPGPASESDELVKLVESLGFENDVFRWPTSEAFGRHILGEEVEFDVIASDFNLGGEKAQAPPGAAIINQLSHYRDLTDDELRDVVQEARNYIAGGQEPNLSIVFNIFRAVYWLASNRLTALTPSEWTAEAKTALETYRDRLNADMTYRIEYLTEDLDQNEGHVRDLIANLGTEIQAMSWARTQEQFIHAIETDEGELPDLVGNAPVFRNVDVGHLYMRLRAGGMAALARFGTLLRQARRVSNAAEFASEDRNFYVDLADHIEREVPSQGVLSILEAELLLVTRDLRSFANNLRGGRK